MIEIEFPEPKKAECTCCGGESTTLTRFVHKDGDAYAIYYATFNERHPESGLIGCVGLGSWGSERGVPSDRVSFGFRLRLEDSQFGVGIADMAETPWHEADIMGRKLSRDEALEHPWIQDVFHLTDHIVVEDAEIRSFFGLETVH